MSQAIVTIELRQGTGCMRYHTCSNYLSFLYTLVTSVLMWIYSDPDGTRSVVIKPFTQPEFEPVPKGLRVDKRGYHKLQNLCEFPAKVVAHRAA